MSLRKDTLSHAYELLKVDDPKKRRRLAEQVARGELSLVKLRDKIEGRRARPERVIDAFEELPPEEVVDDVEAGRGGRRAVGDAGAGGPPTDDSLVNAEERWPKPSTSSSVSFGRRTLCGRSATSTGPTWPST